MKYPNCPPKQVLFSGSNAKEEHAMYTFSTRKQDEHPRVDLATTITGNIKAL